MIHLRTAREIEAIGEGGSIIGRLFEHLETVVAPGVSTQRLDEEVEEFVRSHDGAVPAFKGLYGFPGAACVSVNEEIVHGIPKESVKLDEGDIVTVDVGVRLDGWCSDSAWTFAVGEVDAETQRLLDATGGALDAAICREVHEEPQIPNVGRPGHGPKLRSGMVLAIEPMLSLGTDRIRTLDDRWTVVTQDGSRSAHFEHTVAVTEDGPRILTGSRKEIPHPV